MTLSKLVRIVALSLTVVFLPVIAAQADEIVGSDIAVPTVIVEEVVTAAPPAFVDINSTAIGAGIGVTWGSGTLTFEGRQHGFDVLEVGLGEFGVSTLRAGGAVANLENASDLAGHYVAVGASAALGTGTSTLTMHNSNGVSITLSGVTSGVQFSLATKGIRIEMR
jgi:hypothetical protein